MKGWAARPSLSFAEPNREGVVTRNVLGSYRCPFGEPVQSVKGLGGCILVLVALLVVRVRESSVSFWGVAPNREG